MKKRQYEDEMYPDWENISSVEGPGSIVSSSEATGMMPSIKTGWEAEALDETVDTHGPNRTGGTAVSKSRRPKES